MSLKIDLYAQDGSPLSLVPADIYGRGVGGAELSMMTWAEGLARRGHQVRIYNNPSQPGDHDGVYYLPQSAFVPGEDRDVFIVYRSPNPHTISAKAGIKIHWSTDQYTIGDYGRDIVPHVDKIVCISPRHMDYYREKYNPPAGKIMYLDLGVRLGDYQASIEKARHRFIYCSQSERGLTIVRRVWPEIKEALPDATLVITADHRMWGSHSPNNHQYRLDFLNCDGVVFLGSIPRRELIEHQQMAQIHLYPCIYDELFCISAAECQVAGALPITSETGALATTNEFGVIIRGNPASPAWQAKYVETVLEWARDQEGLTAKAEAGMVKARERFGWEAILDQWEAVFAGEGVEGRRLAG